MSDCFEPYWNESNLPSLAAIGDTTAGRTKGIADASPKAGLSASVEPTSRAGDCGRLGLVRNTAAGWADSKRTRTGDAVEKPSKSTVGDELALLEAGSSGVGPGWLVLSSANALLGFNLSCIELA